jgi:hypothetical protein
MGVETFGAGGKMERMVMQVQHVDGEYRIVLSAEAMEALHLKAGA